MLDRCFLAASPGRNMMSLRAPTNVITGCSERDHRLFDIPALVRFSHVKSAVDSHSCVFRAYLISFAALWYMQGFPQVTISAEATPSTSSLSIYFEQICKAGDFFFSFLFFASVKT